MKVNTAFKVVLTAGVVSYALFRYYKRKPRKAFPVKSFDSLRFLGDWYQIARTDGAHDSSLDGSVTAFSMCEDGSMVMTTIGYDRGRGQFRKLEAHMVFRGSPDVGAFNISYRKPFYRGYNIVALDPDYRHALVVGNTLNEAWVISRDLEVPEQIMEQFRGVAQYIGVEPTSLKMVPQFLEE